MRFLAMAAVGVAAGSCSSFPTAHLSVDFTRETIPVMLTAGAPVAQAKTLDFDAGYRSQSLSTSRTSGGVTTTTSMSSVMFQNKPLATQLRNTLLQTPSQVAVTDLQFENSFTMIFLVGSMETTEYTTHLEVAVPTGGAK